MKALVKRHREVGLWMEDVPMPKVGVNDVLIRVDRTGICGTDVHIYSWAQKTIPVPMVVGHEFVGEIVEVGSNVIDFQIGELVSGEGHVVCGRCRNCLAGRRHLCANTMGVGVNRRGAFAEYVSLPMTNVWVHDPNIDRDVSFHAETMCLGGKVAMLGIPADEMAIDWNLVVFNMLNIKGIYGREMYETWYKMTVMVQGGLDLNPVITHRYDCDEFEKGFQTMMSGQSGKAILKW